MIDKIEFIISSIIALVSIATTLVTFIQKRKTKTIAEILRKVPLLVIEAEEIFGRGNGQAKFAYVTNKIQIECVKAHVTISDDEMSEAIENVLASPTKVKSNPTNSAGGVC